MKKILTAFFCLILIFSAFTLPAFAQSKDNVVLQKSEVINHDYFGGGERVEIAGTVNGDAYVGGGTVIVDGTINGDLLAGGGNITISGTINGDVRTAGGNIIFSQANISGNTTIGGGQITIDKSTVIHGSVVAGGGSIQIFAPIGRGATIGGGTVLIGNLINGDVLAGVGELTMSSDAKINGNLTYWSEDKAVISQGATISGTTKHEIPPKEDRKAYSVGKTAGAAALGILFILKLVDFTWLLVIGLALVLLVPNYMTRSSEYTRKNFGWALLIGLIAVIILPVIGLILFVTLVGIPAALILFFIFILTLWIARILAIFALGQFVMLKMGGSKSQGWIYIAGLAIYFVLSLIPVINFITDMIITLAGIGTLIAMKKEYYTELRKKKII